MLTTTRRHFLAGGGAIATATPLAALAGPQDDLVIAPVTPTSGQDTPYARFANQGAIGLPVGALRIEPKAGLRLDVYLPPHRTRGKVVIFSHGEEALPQIYARMLGHWASHGFAVIAPLHDDSVLVNGLKAHTQGARESTWNVRAILDDTTSWRARTAAVKACLDALPVIEEETGFRMDDVRPIVVGHSFGAFTAQLIVGATASVADGTRLEARDPRFYGAVLLSPQGRGVLGLDDKSWTGVDRPLMVMTGNGDTDATGQTPEQKAEAFSLSPAGHKHLAWFDHVRPSTFTGQQVAAGSKEELVFFDILAMTTAFLVAYGDYDKETFSELSGKYFDDACDGRLATSYR
jgi:pimeloyl-ACP methyl ester carboxylesterase